jgi:hypothetical protein
VNEERKKSLPYSICEDQYAEYKKTKGIPSSAKRFVQHETHCDVIASEKSVVAKFHKISGIRYTITENCIRKLAIGLSTDKRYLKTCSVCSLAYGHYSIPNITACDCFM